MDKFSLRDRPLFEAVFEPDANIPEDCLVEICEWLNDNCIFFHSPNPDGDDVPEWIFMIYDDPNVFNAAYSEVPELIAPIFKNCFSRRFEENRTDFGFLLLYWK